MTATPATNAPGIMQQLRESTADAHRAAERRPLAQAIARATVTPAQYTANLEQLLLVHRALEPALERGAVRHPAWHTLALGERRRVADLEADLGHFGGSLAPAPLPATTALLALLAAASPAMLLGAFYVTEGSTNGGRFLARPVAKALGLDPATRAGLRSLDPYGERQPERWGSFKAAMDAIGFAPESRADLLQGATMMFHHLGEIADQVAATVPA